MAFYLVTVVNKRGSDHPLPLSQQANIRRSAPLRVRGENTEEEQRSWLWWTTADSKFKHFPFLLYSLCIQHLKNRQEVVKPFQWKKPFLELPYLGIGIKADAAGIGIPASNISVQYQRILLPDWVSLFQYRNDSGIKFFFFSLVPKWLDADQSGMRHCSILKNCTKGGNLATVQNSVAHKLQHSSTGYSADH